MKLQIGTYYKTDHFIYRQWDRGVSDELLNAVLPLKISTGKQILVVSKKVLRQYSKNIKSELLIKTDGKTLITCFYCNFNDYFFNAHKRENYHFIQIF